MNNEKIEKKLYDAQEKLPTTDASWDIPQMAEERCGKTYRKPKFANVMVATIAVVFVVIVGGATVLANMELDIYPKEFGQWTHLQSTSWWDCEQELGMRGGMLPECFGDYVFSQCSTTLVAKDEVTYFEALKEHVYEPLHIVFKDEKEENNQLRISVGTTEESYWHYYYEYEKSSSTWKPESFASSFQYRDITVYEIADEDSTSSEIVKWKWVDEANKNCWSVSVPVETGLDGQAIVKEIITLNASYWSEQTIYAHEQSELFEEFELADYKTKDEVYAVLSNEELYVVCYEEALEITVKDTQEKFTISVPYYIESGLNQARTSSIMYDVNEDGVEELIFCSQEGGTCNLRYVEVIDIENQCGIPLAYDVQELVDAFGGMDIAEKESYVFNTVEQDARTFSEDGTIRVATAFGVSIEESHMLDYVGEVVSTLVYDDAQQAYVLDKDSIHIEWLE